MRSTGPRQLSFAFADSPQGGGEAGTPDASGGRAFLLHTAKRKRTARTVASTADTSRLLEEVASVANLAQALLKVIRNKGAPGVDGQTVEEAQQNAAPLLAALRHALLSECYRPGDVRRVWLPKPGTQPCDEAWLRHPKPGSGFPPLRLYGERSAFGSFRHSSR